MLNFCGRMLQAPAQSGGKAEERAKVATFHLFQTLTGADTRVLLSPSVCLWLSL